MPSKSLICAAVHGHHIASRLKLSPVGSPVVCILHASVEGSLDCHHLVLGVTILIVPSRTMKFSSFSVKRVWNDGDVYQVVNIFSLQNRNLCRGKCHAVVMNLGMNSLEALPTPLDDEVGHNTFPQGVSGFAPGIRRSSTCSCPVAIVRAASHRVQLTVFGVAQSASIGMVCRKALSFKPGKYF